MFWILLGFLIAAEAAKLDNTYLPPTGAKESGGSGEDLQLPLEPPYIDPYSPQPQAPIRPHAQRRPQQSYRPSIRGVDLAGNPATKYDGKMLENEEDIIVPTPNFGKGRFISGSYSYTGPDNVLVTVTYKANDNKLQKDESSEEVSNDDEVNNYEQEDEYEDESATAEDETRTTDQAVVEEEEVQEEDNEDSVVPTPPSLPAELARAFDFHKRKQQREQEKTNQKPIRNKKPIKGLHGLNRKKGTHQSAASGQNQYQNDNFGNSGIRGTPASSGHHQYQGENFGNLGMRGTQATSGHHQYQNENFSSYGTGGTQSASGQHHYQNENAGNFGMKLRPTHGNKDQHVHVPPVIHQGYSYAKHN